jgi:hypothetical protein
VSAGVGLAHEAGGVLPVDDKEARAPSPSGSGHDLVRMLHDWLVDDGEHLVEVAGLDDALGEGCVVGFMGSPKLKEREGAGSSSSRRRSKDSQPSAARMRLRPSASLSTRTSTWPGAAWKWVTIVMLNQNPL